MKSQSDTNRKTLSALSRVVNQLYQSAFPTNSKTSVDNLDRLLIRDSTDGFDYKYILGSDLLSGGGTTYTFEQGLTEAVGVVKLGGAITEAITFTDNRVTKIGLQYAADYSDDFTDRSLIDKEYADETVRYGVPEDVTINRDGNGIITSIVTASRTVTFTRDGNDVITDITDEIWNKEILRTGDIITGIDVSLI